MENNRTKLAHIGIAFIILLILSLSFGIGFDFKELKELITS